MTGNLRSSAPGTRAPQGNPGEDCAGTRLESDALGADRQPEARHAPPWFEREHRRLDREFHEHLLAVVGGSFILARQHVQRWRRGLARHIAIEDTRLLPHMPDGARWSARLYRLEHARITALTDAYAARVDAVSENPPRDQRSTRETILSLLDAAHALRHLLEHHHQREEMALAIELPPALQEAAWGYGIGKQQPGEVASHARGLVRARVTAAGRASAATPGGAEGSSRLHGHQPLARVTLPRITAECPGNEQK